MNEKDRVMKKKGNGPEPKFAVVDKRSSFTDEAATPEPRYPSFVDELKRRAEEAEARTREISAAYRQIEQERDAFRERLSRDLERRLEIARADLMRKVLAVLDDLDRALTAARQAGEASPLSQGITIVRDHLSRLLTSEGVEAIETIGKPFDPQFSEAVATEETDDVARDNVVAEEFEKGYMLGGALLRPARVKVARGPRQDSKSAEKDVRPAPELD